MIRPINPVHDLVQFSDLMDRMFSNAPVGEGRHTLALDVLESNNRLVISAAVPGIRPEDVQVSVENNVLTITGEFRSQVEDRDAKVYRQENRYGSFTRSLKLPANLDLDQIDAEFNFGMLNITIPRVETKREVAIRVPIRANALPEAPEA